ncbi:acyltransferase [Microvirga terrae]|uniref:Acyltransferase n=1 Tax=Microvirga terrae TaxID=2740529 RepID=A0ABY5RMF0_9HYPH|nr:acyltransferase [Microvirga terrae]UVF18406.1 acyltransferase [Microvirga terrae]
MKKSKWVLRPESSKLLNLDFLRFVAAIGIVWFHYGSTLIDPIKERLEAFLLFVDLFFVISGYVIAYVYGGRLGSGHDYQVFLRKRVARLIPLHWVTLGLYVALGLALGTNAKYPDMFNWQCLIPTTFLMHSFGICTTPSFNYVSWSISAEFAMYIAFPLLFAVARLRWVPLAAVVIIFVILFQITSGAHPWYIWTHDFGVVRALPAFLFGLSLFVYRDELKRVPAPTTGMFITLALFFWGSFTRTSMGALVPLIYAVVFFGVAADVQDRRIWMVKRIAPLGQLTYSVYMLHLPLQTFLLARVPLDGFARVTWYVLGCFILMAVSWASLVLFETPMRRWISGKAKEVTVIDVLRPRR